MSKYQLPALRLTLDFAGTTFDGAEVVCKTDVSVGLLLRMQGYAFDTDAGAAEAALREFGDKVLVEWNLVDDEGDIPADGDGMLHVSAQFASQLMELWVNEVVNPTSPLPSKSSNGSTQGLTLGQMESVENLNLGDLSKLS